MSLTECLRRKNKGHSKWLLEQHLKKGKGKGEKIFKECLSIYLSIYSATYLLIYFVKSSQIQILRFFPKRGGKETEKTS